MRSTIFSKLATSRRVIFLLFAGLLFMQNAVFGQKSVEKQDVFVDNKGVLRWGGTNIEEHGFGTNHTAPFAHAYRTAKK